MIAMYIDMMGISYHYHYCKWIITNSGVSELLRKKKGGGGVKVPKRKYDYIWKAPYSVAFNINTKQKRQKESQNVMVGSISEQNKDR